MSQTSKTCPEEHPDRVPPTRRLTIVNAKGLHARASAKFVRCAETFKSRINVYRDGQTVGGTSIMGLMMLNAYCGATIDVSATGPDAIAALDAIEALVTAKFEEE